ncbi:hypothetical protein FRC09_008629 [Ceratobasidium sp. 395]|nr:hypothetical protein FRC09_008629 [Ceratobasidium sp. 395]
MPFDKPCAIDVIDRTHRSGEQGHTKSFVVAEVSPNASIDVKLDTVANVPPQPWTHWLLFIALVMLISGPVFCLSFFFSWRRVFGILAGPESDFGASATANSKPEFTLDSDTTNSTNTSSVKAPSSVGTNRSAIPLFYFQLNSEENRVNTVKQTTGLVKKPQLKPLRSKYKSVTVQPVIATRNAPSHPYGGPPVPTAVIASPYNNVIPKAFHHGPKVVHDSWSHPLASRSPTLTGGCERSNAIREESRANVQVLIAALPTTALESTSASTTVRPVTARNGQAHRKSSSMSDWLAELMKANNPSIVVPPAELAKLASVLRSPPSSPDFTPPTTPTISAFASLGREAMSRARVAVGVSHEDKFSAH